MEKNRAPLAGHGWIGVVANLHQPPIGKIVMSHFLLLKPRRWICGIRDGHEFVVVGAFYVIDPGVGSRYLMEGIISPGRQLGIICINSADPENPGGRPAI